MCFIQKHDIYNKARMLVYLACFSCYTYCSFSTALWMLKWSRVQRTFQTSAFYMKICTINISKIASAYFINLKQKSILSEYFLVQMLIILYDSGLLIVNHVIALTSSMSSLFSSHFSRTTVVFRIAPERDVTGRPLWNCK